MEERKKVLIIDPADFVGGAEMFTLDLLQYFHDPSFQIDVLYGGNRDYAERIPKYIHSYVFDFPRLKFLSVKSLSGLKDTVSDLRTFVERGNYDIVQTNSVRAHILASLALENLPAKLCWFLHDFTFPPLLLMSFISKPSHIFCCSQAVSDHLLDTIVYRETDTSKISITPNGIDIDKMEDILASVSKNKRNDDMFRFGIIGRIDRWKGQHIFIKAAAILRKRFRSVHFNIIGQPVAHDPKTLQYFNELQGLTKQLKLSEMVTFTGFVDNLFECMAFLDCIVHCSVSKEPFGRTIIEAMSLHKPVIATNFGGPKEIITHLYDGILIPPDRPEVLADVMQKMIQDTSLRKGLGENAPKKITEKFRIQDIVRKVGDVWGEM